jgi:hypothetical protein
MTFPEHLTTGFDFDEAIALAELCERADRLFSQETGGEPADLYPVLYPAQPWRFVHAIGETTAPARVLIVQRADRQQYSVVFWVRPLGQAGANQYVQVITATDLAATDLAAVAGDANDNTHIHQAGSAAYPPLPGEIAPPPLGVRVYSEWLAALATCQDEIEQFFAEQINISTPQAADSAVTEVEIYLTGHGAGGCMAALGALSLKRRWESRIDFPYFSLKMINFGSPKLGNKAFVDYYHKHMKGFSYRVQNLLDGATYEPALTAPFPYNLQLLLSGVDYVRNGEEYYMTYEHIAEAYTLPGIGAPPTDFHFRRPWQATTLLPFAHSAEGYKQMLVAARKFQERYWKPVQRLAGMFDKQGKQFFAMFQKQGQELQKAVENIQIKVRE